jgi:hypothetical protein
VTNEFVGGHFKKQAFNIARGELYFSGPNFHEYILSDVSRQVLISRSINEISSEVVKVGIINHFKVFGRQLLIPFKPIPNISFIEGIGKEN